MSAVAATTDLQKNVSGAKANVATGTRTRVAAIQTESDVKAYGICGDYPKDVRISEVKRAAEEAIAYDPWITSVDSVSVEEGEDKNGAPCFIVDIEFTDIFRNSILVEGVEV